MDEQNQPLREFLGCWVKLVYDDGGTPHATRGKLVSVVGGFATIETPRGTIAVPLGAILKVCQQENERGSER